MLEKLAEVCTQHTPIAAFMLRWQRGSAETLKQLYHDADGQRNNPNMQDSLNSRFVSTGVGGTLQGSLNDRPTIMSGRIAEVPQNQSQSQSSGWSPDAGGTLRPELRGEEE